MSLDKITKVVLDVKCVLSSTIGALVNEAGAVKTVIKPCPCQRWGF